MCVLRIQVVFHFLIPTSVWNWTKQSQLKIHFIDNVQPKTLEWDEMSPQLSQCQWYVCVYKYVCDQIFENRPRHHIYIYTYLRSSRLYCWFNK